MSLCQKEKGQIGKILNPQSHSPAIYTLSLPTLEKKSGSSMVEDLNKFSLFL